MRIGELAQATGLSTDTLRFYEKQGLLAGSLCTRKENGYRDYDLSAVAHLETVVRAKQLGFTLAEILELSTLWASGQLSDVDKLEVLEGKLAELETKKQALADLQTTIEEKLKRLRTARGASAKSVR